jgi:RNA polymerase sigma-70 factor (ECF subfamily)
MLDETSAWAPTVGLPDEAVTDVWQRGRAAWPGLALEATALARYLAERVPAGADAAAWLRGLHADVFLACACVQRTPGAVRAFETAHLTQMERYLRSLRPTAALVADAGQQLMEKLFLGCAGHPPKMQEYGGRGPLGAWVRVVALRAAIDLLSAEKETQPRGQDADEIARGMAPRSSPDVELMRAAYGSEFTAALREAAASLSSRDRNLLRFTFVEGLTPARVGAIYGVHRTTAMRWIEAAQEHVLAQTRARLIERLRLSPEECDNLIALVRSGIQVTLSSLLKTGV